MHHTNPRRVRRHRIVAAAAAATAATAAVLVLPPAACPAATTANWLSATSGNWADGTKWSTAPTYPNNETPPGSTYNAVIDATGADYVVTVNSSVSVSSLALASESATLLHAANTLTLGSGGSATVSGGAFRLNGPGTATIAGGTITTSGGGRFVAVAGTLSGVIVATDWLVAGSLFPVRVRDNSVLDGRRITLGDATGRGMLALWGSQPLGSNVEIVFDDSPSASPSTLYRDDVGASGIIVTADSVVRTGTGSGSIGNDISPPIDHLNHGMISAQTPGRTLTALSFTNHGQMRAINGSTLVLQRFTNAAGGAITAAAGSTVNFGGNWSNAGTVTTTDATVNLGGTFTTAGMGTFNPSGGAVNITGIMDNTDQTLALEPSRGTWTLSPGGSIIKGTIAATAGAKLHVAGGSISGNTTIAAEVNVLSGATATMSGTNTFAAGGKVTLNGTAAAPHTTVSANGMSIGGPGEVVFDNGTSVIHSPSAGGIVVGSGATWRTGSGSGRITTTSASVQGVSVDGTLSAQTPGQSIEITASRIGTFGTLEARNGGTLTLNGPITNFSGGALGSGNWAVYAGSTINFPGAITASRAAITLSGAGSAFAALDSLETNSLFGSLTLADGRDFTTAGAFTNSSTINVGDGSEFVSTGHFTWSGGSVAGAGVLVAPSMNVTANVSRQGGGIIKVEGPLTISAGRRLILNTSKLVTRDTVGTASGGVYDGIQGLVQSGFNGGAWTGTGITTSGSAATSGLTSLGVATAEQAGHAGGMFGGVSVAAGDVLVMYTYAGDANLDGFISGDDYSSIDFNITVPGASGWFNGDFNYDGIISGDDYSVIDFNIVAQGAPFPTSAASVPRVTAVPEPAAGLATLVAIPALSRHRRRRGPARR